MYKSFYEQVFLRGLTIVYKNDTQASEALQPYFKESKGIQASNGAFWQDSPSKKFFSYESFNARKKKSLVPTSYLQEEY
jgi:hypothetical protein